MRIPAPSRPGHRYHRRAYTLTEINVSMTIFIMILAAVVSSHLFGIRLYTLTKIKLGAQQDARQGLSELVQATRCSWSNSVGNYTGSAYSENADGQLQQGNAIRLYASSNTSSFVMYYRDTDSNLKRLASGETVPRIIAKYITNSLVFSAEMYDGTVCTNTHVNRLIGLNMQFYQVEFPIIMVNNSNYFDYYQLRTKITPRAF
jgi:hypothetical protein